MNPLPGGHLRPPALLVEAHFGGTIWMVAAALFYVATNIFIKIGTSHLTVLFIDKEIPFQYSHI
jgi:hypothetical protein